MMVYINEIEKFVDEGILYFDCFKGVDFCCIEIVCMVFMV